jgi:hypothetical protein
MGVADESVAHWLENGVVQQAHERFDVPVEHAVVSSSR